MEPVTIVPITKRELDVLHELAEGKSNKQIAVNLHISVETVKEHVHSLLSKTDFQGRSMLGAKAAVLFDRIESTGAQFNLDDFTNELVNIKKPPIIDWASQHINKINQQIDGLIATVNQLKSDRTNMMIFHDREIDRFKTTITKLLEVGSTLTVGCTQDNLVRSWQSISDRANALITQPANALNVAKIEKAG